MSDLDDDRALRQPREQALPDAGEEARPQGALVEHEVGLFGIGHRGVVEGRVVDVPAIDAAHELERQKRHFLCRGRALRPCDRRQRLLSLEERHGNVVAAGRARRLVQVGRDVGHSASSLLSRQPATVALGACLCRCSEDDETGPPTGTLREPCQSALPVGPGDLRGFSAENGRSLGQSLPLPGKTCRRRSAPPGRGAMS